MEETSWAEMPGNHLDWSALVPDHDWELYRHVLEPSLKEGVRFSLGGGFAYSTYTHRWRNTKDMDVYLRPTDRQVMVDLVTRAGFEDYFDRSPYDRSWIYRGYRDGTIFDVIWEMANHRAAVDDQWLARAQNIEVRGLRLSALAVEELFWAKLYVFQRERCDWPDLLNLLFAQGEHFDWRHLLDRVGEDAPLVGAVLQVFAWMCPESAGRLPEWIWSRLGLSAPGQERGCCDDRQRIRLLDSRDWFGPVETP